MSLRINTNMEAIDTLRNLTNSQNMFDKAMQQLSSGKRINSAADDAAGYAISQKLMAQNNGLTQAASNAQDGISLVQTASGGLQTSQQLLQRLRQLAVQSANDTNTSSDRTALQAEANQISVEITQIATTTQFNTKNLLDGSLASTGTVTAAGGTALTSAMITTAGSLGTGTYTLNVVSAGAAAVTTTSGSATTNLASSTVISDTTNGIATGTANGVATGTYSLTLTGSSGSASVSINASTATFGGVVTAINADTTSTGITASLVTTAGIIGIKLTNAKAGSTQAVTVSGTDTLMKGLGIVAATGSAASTTASDTVQVFGTDGAATLNNGSTTVSMSAQGNKFIDTTSGFIADFGSTTPVAGSATLSVTNNGLNLQVGANASQNLTVGIANINSSLLSVQGTAAGTALDISSSATMASNTITIIDAAIQITSSTAANLGAVQNRLQAAINNLNIGSENMQAAYSSITNVNMAQQSTSLASAQILQQAGIAMLAQANQAPQGVLKLLG